MYRGNFKIVLMSSGRGHDSNHHCVKKLCVMFDLPASSVLSFSSSLFRFCLILRMFLAALETLFHEDREKFRVAAGCKNIAGMKVNYPACRLRLCKP